MREVVEDKKGRVQERKKKRKKVEEKRETR